MNLNINNDVIQKIRVLYQANDMARIFFDWAASRQRDARATTIETVMRICDCRRAEAVSLAKELEERGCGEFLFGRRGASSRIKWDYSLISLGRAAAGETAELETVDRSAVDDEENEAIEGGGPATASSVRRVLTIHEAKEALAQAFGVSPGNVEITIKA